MAAPIPREPPVTSATLPASCPSMGCGFFELSESAERHSGHGFRPHRASRLKSRCFGGRDGEKPAMARDSHEFESRAVRAICLAASAHGASRPRAETELACDLQLYFAVALPGLPVEGAADREGSAGPSGNSLHAHLSRLSALASRRMP